MKDVLACKSVQRHHCCCPSQYWPEAAEHDYESLDQLHKVSRFSEYTQGNKRGNKSGCFYTQKVWFRDHQYHTTGRDDEKDKRAPYADWVIDVGTPVQHLALETPQTELYMDIEQIHQLRLLM